MRGVMVKVLAGSVACGIVAGAIVAPSVAQTGQGAIAAAERARGLAVRRARSFDRAAARARDMGERMRLQGEAVAARVAAAEAEIALGETRVRATQVAAAQQRERLAVQQGPVARLLAALASLARRPAPLAIVQPGSLDDLVHAQAVLRATLPAVAARTADLRVDLARTRALQASAAAAARQLGEGRVRLVAAQRALAALRDPASAERALALGEQARDIVDQLSGVTEAQAIAGELVRLPGPPLVARPRDKTVPYRMPVAGQLATGLGEVSQNGVRARGLTLLVAPNARVVAPAAGRVRYARPFRGFGRIVIVDHGLGWVTLLTGLGELAVGEGDDVVAGAAIGRAAAADAAPQVTVELRRRGRPVDIAALVG